MIGSFQWKLIESENIRQSVLQIDFNSRFVTDDLYLEPPICINCWLSRLKKVLDKVIATISSPSRETTGQESLNMGCPILFALPDERTIFSLDDYDI